MAAKWRLTDKLATDAVADPEKAARGLDTFIWDTAVPLFALKLSPGGGKSWIKIYRTADGRERRVTIGSLANVSASAARKRAIEIGAAARDGRDPQAEKIKDRKALTFGQYAEMWLEVKKAEAARGEMSKATITEYKSKVSKYIVPDFGQLKPKDLKAATLKLWRDQKLTDHANANGERLAGPASVNSTLRVVSTICSFLIEREIIVNNPAKGLGQFAYKRRERYLTEEETDRLYVVLDKYRDQRALWVAIIELALATGMRKGEVLSLRWDSIEWEPIPRIILAKHKTAKTSGNKYMALNAMAVEVLEVAKTWRQGVYVFPAPASALGQDGEAAPIQRPASAGGLQGVWTMVRKEAGLGKVDEGESFVFHGTRHSWASKAISAGESLGAVGAALGHANAGTTNAYAKITSAAAQKPSDAVGGILAASRARARKSQGG